MRSSLVPLLAAAFFLSCGGTKPLNKPLKVDGESCAKDDECQSGLCFALRGEALKCGAKCSAGCPSGTRCTQLDFQRYGCVPDVPSLCRACATRSDCPYPADACLELSGVKVCGQDCSNDGACAEVTRWFIT